MNYETGIEKTALGYSVTLKIGNQTFLLMPFDTEQESIEYKNQLDNALKTL